MFTTPHLTRQQIRDQRAREVPELEDPVTADDARRALGWDMLEAERQGRAERGE